MSDKTAEKKRSTIRLPKNPDGEQYEDLVVAALLALGYFVEAQLKLREGKKDVLELDVVASPLGGTLADRVLFEVKKERFSFTNVFKLFGQRIYLQIPNAALVSLRGADADYVPVYEAKAGAGEVILSKRHEFGLLSNFAPPPFSAWDRRR